MYGMEFCAAVCVGCGIVESPFATLREIVHDCMEHFSGLPFFFLSNLALGRREHIAHFSADAVNPEAGARHIHQPMLAHPRHQRPLDCLPLR